MVTPCPPARGRLLLGCLLALCVCWAFCSPLSSLARAEGPSACPEGVLDASELGQPEYEVRELRSDLRSVCAVLAGRLDQSLTQGKALEVALANLDADVRQLHEDVTVKGGLPVNVAGQLSTFDVAAPEGVEVSNPPDVASVKAAVDQNSETFDSNAWGITGLLVGLGALAWIYKLVRP
jgi:hypothetical protein